MTKSLAKIWVRSDLRKGGGLHDKAVAKKAEPEFSVQLKKLRFNGISTTEKKKRVAQETRKKMNTRRRGPQGRNRPSVFHVPP